MFKPFCLILSTLILSSCAYNWVFFEPAALSFNLPADLTNRLVVVSYPGKNESTLSSWYKDTYALGLTNSFSWDMAGGARQDSNTGLTAYTFKVSFVTGSSISNTVDFENTLLLQLSADGRKSFTGTTNLTLYYSNTPIPAVFDYTVRLGALY